MRYLMRSYTHTAAFSVQLTTPICKKQDLVGSSLSHGVLWYSRQNRLYHTLNYVIKWFDSARSFQQVISLRASVNAVQAQKRFEFLEHTADVYVAAYGADLEEAFENAALATFHAMTEVDQVQAADEDVIEVRGQDEHALLYNWLEELLVKFEITYNIYSRFKISSIEKTPDSLRLKAKIWGEPFDPEKHPQKVGIKAVTYHLMEIIKRPKGVTVRFILDA